MITQRQTRLNLWTMNQTAQGPLCESMESISAPSLIPSSSSPSWSPLQLLQWWGSLLLIILSLIPATCSFSALGNPKRNKPHKAPYAMKRETPGAKTGSRGPTTFIGIPMCCPSNKLTWRLKRLIPSTITRMTANLSFYNYLSFSFCITSSLTWSYMISLIKTWQAIVLN